MFLFIIIQHTIKNNKFENENLHFEAKPTDVIANPDKFDRYSSIQHAKLIDAYIDKNGQKHGRFIDNYDFNKRPNGKLKDKLKNYPNNHGYSLQEKEALENYYTVIDVLIDKDEELKKKLKKKFF